MNYPDENVRSAPHNLQAEQSVIGGLMLDNQAYQKIAHLVLESDFYREDHRLIYRSLQSLAEENKPMDWITLVDWLEKNDSLELAGGSVYLGTLIKDTPSAANIVAYANIVAEASQRRQFISLMNDQIDQAYKAKDLKPRELLDEAERKLFALGEQSRRGTSAVRTAKQVLKTTLADIERLSELEEGEIPGLTSPWSELDEVSLGDEPGDLVIVAGRPAMGKTIFASNKEDHVAGLGKPVLTFTMEMTAEKLMKRKMSALSGVPFDQIRRGKIDESNWPRVATNAVKPMADWPWYVDDTRGRTVDEIRAEARRVHRDCQRIHGQGLALIVIDYLGLIEMGGGTDNRAAQIAEVTRKLKNLAGELNTVVYLLCQLNRGLESRPNKRPLMSDLRESGAIEQDADGIWFIYRDEVYNPDSPDKGTAEIIPGKARAFKGEVIRLSAQFQCQRFASYTPEVAGFE